MAFRRVHDSPSATLSLAQAAGVAEARKRQEDQAFQLAQQMQERRDRIELAGMNNQFRKESTAAQMKFDYDQILMRQAHDFDMKERLREAHLFDEEQKRKRKRDEYEAVLDAIDSSEEISDREKGRFKLNAQVRYGMGAGAPQFDIESDAQRQRAEQIKGRYDMAVAAEKRTQEKHEKAMSGEPTFATRKSALDVVQEVQKPNWLEKLLPGGVGPLSPEEKSILKEAESILNWKPNPVPEPDPLDMSKMIDAPAPQSVDEFKEIVGRLKAEDPVKARQYFDMYQDRY
jgi:hypothetical protein